MLSGGRENLAGKLLLSSALVAASLAYGVWQRHDAVRPRVAMLPATPKMAAPAPDTMAPAPMTAAPAAPAAPANPAGSTPADTSPVGEAAKSAPPVSAPVAMASPPPAHPPVPAPVAAVAPPPQDATPPSPSSAAPVSAQAALQMRLPTDDVSPPIPLATGTPPAGVTPPIPAGAGTHLQDGDYLSDKHQFEWGDLKIKVSIHGGQITGVQILQYPDHRSRSLDLSLMAGPTLESEVIKTQQVQVDIVSSATDTSYAFQDAIANVIVKAARE